MALTLNDLDTSERIDPPRILIYGPPGLGKTTLSAEFPKPILFDIERGRPRDLSRRSVPGFDEQLTDFGTVMQALESLSADKHGFETVIVDTLDRLEPLLWDYLCKEQKWKSIEEPGYGKGYAMADGLWRDFFGLLEDLRKNRGMAIVLVAHASIERFDSPTSASYSRYDIRLHKRALAMVQDLTDAVLFVNQDVTIQEEKAGFGKVDKRAEGGGNTWVYCTGRPAYTAKNRYGLPDKFLYRKGKGYATIAPNLTLPADMGSEAAE